MSADSSETLSFSCPHCGKRLHAPAKALGRKVKCPKCSKTIEVGASPSTPTAPNSPPKQTSPLAPATSKESTAPKKTSLLEMEDPFSLASPAIEDLNERERASSEKREEKEQKRVLARKRKANRDSTDGHGKPSTIGPRPASTAKPHSDSKSATSANQPISGAAQLNDAGLIPFDDDTASSQPVNQHSASEQASTKSPAAKPASSASSKGALFDGDLDVDELRLQAEAAVPAPTAPIQQHASSPNKNGKRPPKKRPTAPPVNLDDLDDLVPSPNSVSNADLLDDLPELADELVDNDYRVVCKTCGTAQYVAPSAQGMKIKCPDCHSNFKVPPPPADWKPKTKKKTKSSSRMSDALDDELGLAPNDIAEDTADMHKRDRVQDLLEKARGEVTEEHDDDYYAADFDNANFVQRTFGFLRDPMTMAQVAIYAVVFFGLFATAQFGLNDTDSQFGRGMLLITVVLVPLVGILFALPMLSGGLALIESVANKQQRVNEFPAFNLFDNGADLLVVAVAFAASIIPGFIIGRAAGGEDVQMVFELCGMVLSAFILFPIFLLSMMDNGSIFAPVSHSVLQSIPRAAEAWGGYYLKTFVASTLVILVWLVLLGRNPVLAGIAGTLFPLLIFFTCQQIGVLADGIGNHLSFHFTPPKTREPHDEHDDHHRESLEEY